MSGAQTGNVVHRNLQVPWVSLVQFGESRFGYPIGPAAAIGIYQWLLCEAPEDTQAALRGCQYANRNGPGYHMDPTPLCAAEDARGVRMLSWQLDLRLRFAGVLLPVEASAATRRWARRASVHVDRTSVIPVRHRHWDRGEEAIKKFGALENRRFAMSPNSVHRRAVRVFVPLFQVRHDGFSAVLEYGYPSEKKFGSAWRTGIDSRPRELFCDFMMRATSEFEALMVPASEPAKAASRVTP